MSILLPPLDHEAEGEAGNGVFSTVKDSDLICEPDHFFFNVCV